MPPLAHPILVVSYGDDIRAALVASLEKVGAVAVACSTFLEAEERALSELYHGILVDLPSMIKSKGEEKIVACSLTGFYPTLRVRTVGSMLIPMTMPGGAKQDNSLNDFISRSCAAFTPRTLRSHRRFDVCVPAMITQGNNQQRCITLNLSWDGVFLIDMHPERFQVGEELSVTFLEPELTTNVCIRWIRPWGERRPPGIGVKFHPLTDTMEAALFPLIKHPKGHDRDRILA